MDTSLNKESKGQNRAFEETEEMVKSELSKDGKTLDLTACYLKELGAKMLPGWRSCVIFPPWKWEPI